MSDLKPATDDSEPFVVDILFRTIFSRIIHFNIARLCNSSIMIKDPTLFGSILKCRYSTDETVSDLPPMI